MKHLARYLAEFTYRFNNREEEDLWAMVIANLVIASALPYAKLTKPAKVEAKPEETLDDLPF